MLEKIKEYRDVFAERVRSPFGLTFIAVWCIYHWELLMLVFFNDIRLQLWDRIHILKYYIENKGFLGMVIKPALYSLAALALYTIGNSLGLVIKLLYDKWVSPFIQERIDKNNVDTADKVKVLKRERVKLISMRDDEKNRNILLESDIRQLKENFKQLQNNSIPINKNIDIKNILNSNYSWYYVLLDVYENIINVDYCNIDSNRIISISNPNSVYKVISVNSGENNNFLQIEFETKNTQNNLFLVKDDDLFFNGFSANGNKAQLFANKSTFRIIRAYIQTPIGQIEVTLNVIYYTAKKRLVFNTEEIIRKFAISDKTNLLLVLSISQKGKSGYTTLEFKNDTIVDLKQFVVE